MTQVCVRVIRKGDSYHSSSYVHNELKKPHDHYHRSTAHTNIRRKDQDPTKFRAILDRNYESEGGQVLVEKNAQSGTNRRKQNGVMLLFRKGHIFQDWSRRGYPTTSTSRAPKVDADDGGGAPDGGGGVAPSDHRCPFSS